MTLMTRLLARLNDLRPPQLPALTDPRPPLTDDAVTDQRVLEIADRLDIVEAKLARVASELIGQ